MEADFNSNYMPLGRFYSNMAAKLKNTASWWRMVCKKDAGATQTGHLDIPEKLAGQTKIIRWEIQVY